MSLRISSALALLLLVACEERGDEVAGSEIECALGGAASFAPECTMERAEAEGERLLIVRHPDGAFRRFEFGVPGRGIVTADGVEQAVVERSDGTVEVRVGADRYRFPVAE
ncbi:hypothetical protein [Aurantiacibacter aquimixticola]|uniref:Lipoprotein n=1 Tax=Aurantiacibacter aquimixticola TaxID=1958945 RepID=A0A419RS63_9SPHN|nr:hypothetical protein [Aurantiacibacter aquimixticola]RJY08615.1 hypothetical protein D6201_03885 [Aurantiacibacter aquimixticola]